jgi:hypothetical protein
MKNNNNTNLTRAQDQSSGMPSKGDIAYKFVVIRRWKHYDPETSVTVVGRMALTAQMMRIFNNILL